MPCLFAILALMTPRLVIILLYVFSNWLHTLTHQPIWVPVLGFLFLPTTMLWFVAVHHWFGGQWTLWPVVGLVVAILIDVSPASGRRRVRYE